MTPEQQKQLAALRERRAKATPGPLYVVQLDRECGEYSNQYYTLAVGPYEDDAADCFAFSHETCDRSDDAASIEANFELFAHAPADIDLLLALLADAERERDEADRDSDILLGVEWRRSVQATNGDPEAAREHRIAALVADLHEVNERAEQAADARQAEIVGWLRMQADRGDKHIDEHGLDRHTHPSTVQAISTMRTTADAIERGEFREKGGGDAN